MKPTTTKKEKSIEDRIAQRESRSVMKIALVCSVVFSLITVGGISIVSGEAEKMIKDLIDLTRTTKSEEGGAHQTLRPSEEKNP